MHPKIEMDATERDEFLSSHKTARIGTVSPNGYPHTVPVGFLWRDRNLYFPSDEHSQKIANCRRDGRICAVVDDGTAGEDYETLAGVMIQGDTTIYDETGHETVTHQTLLEHLFEGEIADQERYERVDRVVVEVEPHDIVTWDFSKI